ncbi:hypothetical protein ACERK3_10445 [Phycisphaerales bacterium AB-hyl4]|uniref:Rod shape-determining protein MreD n=1 Tax=Natronomicrosphaera hydrolytica TaxID=3242702 RepID=A0ABV4U594_9BACT
MNWLIFIIAAYVLLALESGLRLLLQVWGVSPSLLLVLAVYVGLMAPSAVVPWAFLILGLLTDLQPGPVRDGTVIGPAALGYLAGAYVVLQLRGMVFRESVLALAVLVLVVGIFVQLVYVALLTARGMGMLTAEPIVGWSTPDQLAHRFVMLLYTAVAAVPLGFVLFRTAGAWGFANRARTERHF